VSAVSYSVELTNMHRGW